MSLTRIGSIGINTGIAFAGVTTIVTLNTANDALSIGATVNVGSGITLGASGDVFFTGIATGNGSGLTALNATQLTSGTVPTARLGSGTASSSTFLRGDSTFAAVTSTTINSNADNRVITGSDTANTLNGEANLAFDGTGLGLVGHIDIRTGSSINTNVTGSSASGTLHKNTTSGQFAIVSGGTGGNNYLSFFTSASAAPTEKLRIEADGAILVSNSTGIGIGAATNGSSTYPSVTISGTSGGAVHFEDDGDLLADIYGSSSGLSLSTRKTSDAIIFQTNSGTVTEKLRIGADSNITQTIDTDGDGFIITAGDMKPMLTGNSNRSAENNTIFGISGKWNNTEVGRIAFEAGADTTNKDDGRIRFYTRKSGGSLTQRAMIDDEGRMGVKTNSPDATLHVGGIIDNHPVLLLEGGGSTTGDLTVPATENVQVGHWDSSSNTYTNRFQINTGTGNVTMPSQACMVFVDPVDISTVSNAGGYNLDPIHFNTQHINNGGMSSSNTKSRITVPTAGTYLIQGLLSGSVTTASAGDGIQIKIKRNGSVYPNDQMFPAEGMGDYAGKEYAFSFSVPITLAVNDYVEICFDNIGGSIQYNLAYGYFAVTLLH